MVIVRDLEFAYNREAPLLRQISFSLHSGERTALMGYNGSGKTTLARLLKGLLKQQKGSIELNGLDTSALSLAETAGLIEYSFQNPDDQICQGTVRGELSFLLRNLNWKQDEIDKAVHRVSRFLDLTDLLTTNPYDLDFYMRKRLALGSILVSPAPFMIFDEPDAGQDWKYLKKLGEYLSLFSAEGRCILVISHNSEWISRYFDRVIMLSDGEIIFDGTPSEGFSRRGICSRAGVISPVLQKMSHDLGLSGHPVTPAAFAETYVRDQRTGLQRFYQE